MKGIDFVVDERGKKKAVQIDLEEWGEQWEDFYDGVISMIRRKEQPRVKWEDLKQEIADEKSRNG
jgi:hypothetical protein